MHRSLEGNIDSKNNNKKHTNKQPGKGSKVMSGIDINIDFLVFLLQEPIRLKRWPKDPVLLVNKFSPNFPGK